MRFYVCAITSILLTASLSSAASETTGLSFLQIGIDGRAVGMGEAHAAVASGASATYWNPAGILHGASNEIFAGYHKWFQDTQSQYAAYIRRFTTTAWGISAYTTNIENFEHRTKPSQTPLGTFGAHYFSGGLSYARIYSDNLYIGITGKYLFEKIFFETASGIAADIGMCYTLNANWTVAGILRHLGTMSSLKTKKSSLPTAFRAGAAWQRQQCFTETLDMLIAVDVESVSGGNHYVYLGAEGLLKKSLAVRLGYTGGYDTRSISGGFGILWRSVRFDYGLTPMNNDFGSTHRFSAVYGW